MVIALLGGTFNPVHNGHLLLANKVRREFNYDKIVFVPSYIPAHKDIQGGIAAGQRLEMLLLAINNLPWAECSDCEIIRQGVSYTIETLEFIASKYTLSGRMGLIIGDDLLVGFSSWKNPEKIVEMADLIVAHRMFKEEVPFPFDHRYVNNTIYPLSSSEIRALVKQNRSLLNCMPRQVLDYIGEKKLYRGENT